MVQETRVQSQVKSYQRLKKCYLMPPYLTLSIIRYGSRVSGTIQGKELCPSLHLGEVTIEKRTFGWPLTMVSQLTYYYRPIGLVGKMFANGLGDRVQS